MILFCSALYLQSQEVLKVWNKSIYVACWNPRERRTNDSNQVPISFHQRNYNRSSTFLCSLMKVGVCSWINDNS